MNESFAVALAGGGTRGAYQVGACKAIREIGLEIKAVTGTSIGAINGCFFATDEIDLLEDLYENIRPEQIIDTSLKLDYDKDIFHISNFLKVSREFIISGGYKNTPLRKMLEANLDLDKMYSASRDYGLVTFDLGSAKMIEKFRDDIPREQLIDHVLASAAMPLFKTQKIGNKRYSDGGIADNLPVNMLVKKGYKNIIAVDLHGIGIIPPLKKDDVYVKTIRPTVSLGGLMEFNKERMKRNRLMGYMDALKAFGRFQGERYFFDPDEYTRLLSIFNIRTLVALETAATVFGIDEYQIYDSVTFPERIFERYLSDRDHSETDKISIASSRKRVLLRMVIQAKSSPVHNVGPEGAFFADLSEAAKALIELEQYMKTGYQSDKRSSME